MKFSAKKLHYFFSICARFSLWLIHFSTEDHKSFSKGAVFVSLSFSIVKTDNNTGTSGKCLHISKDIGSGQRKLCEITPKMLL